MLIVADSSALITLATCDSLSLLEKLFKEIKVPKAVFDEVIIEGKYLTEILQPYLINKVEHVDISEFVIDASNLGKGEIEAMALYKKLHADYLLIDDLRARKIATMNNIKVIGSLGVLLIAKQKHFIATIKPALEKIRASDIYVSEFLLREVLKIAMEE